MRRRHAIAVTGLALLGAGPAACGDEDTTSSAASTPTSTNQSGPPITNTSGSPAPSTVTLTADPGGALAYDTTELVAAAGQPHIVFENPSSVDHDVTIEDANGNVIGQSEVISKDSAEISISAESDVYTFYCSVDSHREAGMEGTLALVNN